MAEKAPIRDGLFQEGPEGTIILAGRCRSCGQVFFPKAPLCYTSNSDKMEDISLSRKGRLYSYSVVHMPSSNFKPPYAVGYVDMQEGIRIFGQRAGGRCLRHSYPVAIVRQGSQTALL